MSKQHCRFILEANIAANLSQEALLNVSDAANCEADLGNCTLRWCAAANESTIPLATSYMFLGMIQSDCKETTTPVRAILKKHSRIVGAVYSKGLGHDNPARSGLDLGRRKRRADWVPQPFSRRLILPVQQSREDLNSRTLVLLFFNANIGAGGHTEHPGTDCDASGRRMLGVLPARKEQGLYPRT